jgi:hypothetical protein
MALIKNNELDTGVTVSYWRIIKIELTEVGTLVMVGGYLDKAARDAGKNPITIKQNTFLGEDDPMIIATLDELNKNPYSVAYDKLKADVEFFQDATDDL